MSIEKDVADSINDEVIIQQFQNMKNLQKKILKSPLASFSYFEIVV